MGMTGTPVAQAAVDAGVAAAKAWARAGGTGEDALWAQLVRAAIGAGEAWTGLRFVRRAQEDVVAATGAWVPLDWGPVSAITGVTALPAGAAPAVLPVDAYALDIDGEGRGWVRVTAAGGAGVGGVARAAVQYQAGLAATWDALPEAVAQGVAVLAAEMFAGRAGPAAPPAGVAALWRPWRRIRLMGLSA